MTLEFTERKYLALPLQVETDLLQVETDLDSSSAVKVIREHPLAKFVGILSDSEAAELQRSITDDRGQIDWTEG